MKYSGRILLVTLLIGNAMIWISGHCWAHDRFVVLVITTVLICTPIYWLIGRQYDKAKHHAETDDLTGLYNRRFVHAMFSKQCLMAERNRNRIAILLVDINNFKTINDRYGHAKGDSVLREVSALLQQYSRKGDVVSRWGGDEFVVIAPYCDATDADSLVSKLNERLLLVSADMQVDISVSGGSSVYPDDASHMEELLRIADKNMYRTKAKYKEQ